MTSLRLIHEKVCQYFDVDYLFPFQRSNKRKVIYIRQVFHYIARKKTNNNAITFNEIGSYLSDIVQPFNHATVMHSCKKIEGYLLYDKQLIKDIDNIEKMLPKKQL